MKNKQYPIIIVLALISGFIGSALSNYFFIGNPAFAEKNSKPAKVIEAEEFRLVDSEGKAFAFLKTELYESFDKRAYRYPVLKMDKMRLSNNELKFEGISGRKTRVDDLGIFLMNGDYGDIFIVAGAGSRGPFLDIKDKEGKTRTVLGSVELKMIETGEYVKRSESSLVFFGEDGKTVWQAP